MKRLARAALLLLLAGCERHASTPSAPVWEQPRRRIVAPGIERLPSGDCLDRARLPRPWRVDPKQPSAMLADAARLGVRQTGYDWSGSGGPGVVSVGYGAWVMPPPGAGRWQLAEPSRLRWLLRQGQMCPIETVGPLTVALFGGERDYYDARLITQCRESALALTCAAVSTRNDWAFTVDVDAGQGMRLPALLRKLEQAVERTRRACPT